MCSILVGACTNIEDVNTVKSVLNTKASSPPLDSTDNQPVLLHTVQHICIKPDKFAQLVKDFDETMVASWVLQSHNPSEPSGTGFLTANSKTGSTTVAYATQLVNAETGSVHGRVCVAFVGIKYSSKIKEKRSEKVNVRNLLESDL